ncbi:MAG: rhomboid family intramembrane serine protease [Mycobacteriaceae bacterium]|uniref:rhomboid family intramembrane serine protease n=1 Tax=Corynebacterium sp. TaxID=1720 RepID=UPI003F9D2216
MDTIRRFFRGAPATVTLIVACVVVYAATALDARSALQPAYTSELAWRLMIDPPAITGGGEWWRLVTGALVHLDIGHLLLNLLLIAFVGRELERAYGTTVMVVSILVCAVGGALAVIWLQPDSIVGGASTVGYGMFAMLVGLSLSRGTDVRAPVALIVVNLLYSLTSGVSLPGHLGGLGAGALVAVVLFAWGRRGRGGRAPRPTSTPWS